MIYSVVVGGLGNQLFQIFAAIAYGLQNGHSFAFNLIKTDDMNKRPTYWTNFLSELMPNVMRELLPEPTYLEKGVEYKELPIVSSDDSICVFGNFQSELYFKSHYSTICDLINLRSKQDLILERFPEYSKMISMHFRLGDYKSKGPEYHPIMSCQYYKNALRYILEHRNKGDCNDGWNGTDVLFFCETEDYDTVNQTIMELQVEFPQLVFNRAPEISDWEQMLLMSNCPHHIIANSTFSWWGAYFNRNINGNQIVCYPNLWFGHQLYYLNTTDLCPTTWIKIEA